MTQEQIKIGFAGTGAMGQMAHLSNYTVLSGCKVVAIAEPRKDLAEQIARRYDIPNVFLNHEELLASGLVDAIVAPQPFTRHAIIIPDILRAKVPVFTEKPLCVSVEAGEELVKVGEESGTLHMVGYHKRSDPAMEYGKKVIEDWKKSGECGKLRYVRVTMPPGDWIKGSDPFFNSNEPYPTSEHEAPIPYYDKAAQDSYFAFVNYYIHQVNLIQHVLGETYEVRYADRSGALLAAESKSGVTATLEMAPYQSSHDWNETVFAGFEKGYVQVDLPAPLARQQAGRVKVFQDNGQGVPMTSEPSMPNVHAMRNQALNFLAAIRGERPAPCAAKEALHDLRVAKQYIDMMNEYRK